MAEDHGCNASPLSRIGGSDSRFNHTEASHERASRQDNQCPQSSYSMITPPRKRHTLRVHQERATYPTACAVGFGQASTYRSRNNPARDAFDTYCPAFSPLPLSIRPQLRAGFLLARLCSRMSFLHLQTTARRQLGNRRGWSYHDDPRVRRGDLQPRDYLSERTGHDGAIYAGGAEAAWAAGFAHHLKPPQHAISSTVNKNCKTR
jgi:hypothetical protein